MQQVHRLQHLLPSSPFFPHLCPPSLTFDPPSETMQQVHRLQHLLDQRNTEFHELQSRLKDLQRGPGGAGGGEDIVQYKEQLERLRSRSVKERQELQEHLRCVIRSHEGTLATKEKAFVTLEEQVKQQSQQIKSLHKDKQSAILSKTHWESTIGKLQTKITEQEEIIGQLRQEKQHLEQQMLSINERLSLTADSTSEREQLVLALQKVTASRNKHKKHAEDLQQQVHRLTQDVQRNESEIVRTQLLLEENQATNAMTVTNGSVLGALSQEQSPEKEKLVSDEQQQQQELQQQHQQLQEQQQQHQQQLDELLSELALVQSQRDQLQSDHQQKALDTTMLTGTIASLRSHIGELIPSPNNNPSLT